MNLDLIELDHGLGHDTEINYCGKRFDKSWAKSGYCKIWFDRIFSCCKSIILQSEYMFIEMLDEIFLSTIF